MNERPIRRPPAILAASIAVAIAALVGMPTSHAAEILRLDPQATQVTWTLGSTFHDVHGTFALTGGEIRFDPASGEAGGRVEIAATSGESGNKSRDKKMHEDVLESAKYPGIVFLPERMAGDYDPAKGGQVTLEGTIELHGIREKISVTADVVVSGSRLTGTAHLEIPYVAWGMEDPSAFIFRADKVVAITLHLDGNLAPDTGDIVAPDAPE